MKKSDNDMMTGFSWQILSKYRIQLYGISILLIVIHHAFGEENISALSTLPLLKNIFIHGYVGVDMFLFLGGISSYYSLKKDSCIKNYYRKRIIRILLPVMIVDWTYWIWKMLYYSRTVSYFIQKITFYSFWSGQNDTLVWYIALIVILYFFTPYIIKIINTNYSIVFTGILIVSVCVVNYILNNDMLFNLHDWYTSVSIALNRIPVYILGCFCGKYVYQNKKITSNQLLIIMITALWGLSYCCYERIPFTEYHSLKSLYRIPACIIGISFAFLIAILMEFINIYNFRMLNRILTYIGNISLELYLTHVVLKDLFKMSALYTLEEGYAKINFMNYMLFVGIGAVVLSSIVKLLTNCVKINLERRGRNRK